MDPPPRPTWEYVESEFDDDLLCPTSLQPLVDPVMHSCGNMFSSEELTKVSACPLCRGVLTGESIGKVPNFIRNKVDILRVWCSRCEEVMPRERFEEHANRRCSFACPSGCGEETTYEGLASHLEEVCLHKRVDCGGANVGCPYQTLKKDMPEHERECLFLKLAPAF